MSAPIWQVPENVAAAVAERWPDRGPAWVEKASAELADLCAEYDATPSLVFPARYALAVAAETRDGRALVFRPSPDPAAGNHATVSQALAHDGLGPTIHDVMMTETGTWMVPDRVVPGDSLLTMPVREAVFAEITRLLRGLVGRPAPPGLPRLSDWLRERLEDDNLTDLAPNTTPASPVERKHALAILDDLERDQPDNGLCHGDMSGANILRGANDRLFLIDPRGIAGDVAYDAAVLGTKAAGYEFQTARSPFFNEIPELTSHGSVHGERSQSLLVSEPYAPWAARPKAVSLGVRFDLVRGVCYTPLRCATS